jgi:hypothetical protein
MISSDQMYETGRYEIFNRNRKMPALRLWENH